MHMRGLKAFTRDRAVQTSTSLSTTACRPSVVFTPTHLPGRSSKKRRSDSDAWPTGRGSSNDQPRLHDVGAPGRTRFREFHPWRDAVVRDDEAWSRFSARSGHCPDREMRGEIWAWGIPTEMIMTGVRSCASCSVSGPRRDAAVLLQIAGVSVVRV
jgi:hypothetical protein